MRSFSDRPLFLEAVSCLRQGSDGGRGERAVDFPLRDSRGGERSCRRLGCREDGIRIEGADDLLPSVMALKQSKPSLKVLLMIGGWGEKANGFSAMAMDPAKRTEFCLSCKSHIDNYGFDGIDIDWEYRHDDSSGTLRRALCRTLYSGAETTTE